MTASAEAVRTRDRVGAQCTMLGRCTVTDAAFVFGHFHTQCIFTQHNEAIHIAEGPFLLAVQSRAGGR
jgi:hypothetical protein